MEYKFEHANFSKTILTGLFAGITGTAVNLFVFILFTSQTVQTESAGVANPFTIFFGSVFPPLIFAFIFSLFSKFRMASLVYFIIVAACSCVAVIALTNVHFLSDVTAEAQFHKILTIMICVVGILTLSIPYFVRHPKLLKAII